MDIQRQATQIGNIRFDREVDEGEVISTKRGGVLERKIPIKPSYSLLAAAREDSYATESGRTEIRNSPRRSYHEPMSFDQAGPATIAYDSSYSLYAIKRYKCNLDNERKIFHRFKHSALVNIQDLIRKEHEIHVVYECMDVSLQHILATPRGHLASLEIAVICK